MVDEWIELEMSSRKFTVMRRIDELLDKLSPNKIEKIPLHKFRDAFIISLVPVRTYYYLPAQKEADEKALHYLTRTPVHQQLVKQ